MGLLDLFRYQPIQKKTKTTSTPYTGITYERNPYSDSYYKEMEKIEAMWSVLYNLNAYSGNEAQKFEELCYHNIELKRNMDKWELDRTPEWIVAPHVPAFVRLAMLYEKRDQYEEAINICVTAIKEGAVRDGNKGMMYGRLARLLKKSGFHPTQEITQLLTQKEM